MRRKGLERATTLQLKPAFDAYLGHNSISIRLQAEFKPLQIFDTIPPSLLARMDSGDPHIHEVLDRY